MFTSIKEVPDLSPFEWIQDELRSRVGTPPWADTALRTLDVVPPRFAAYAKIFHPIYENPNLAGRNTTWDEVERERRMPSVHPVLERMEQEGTLVRTGVGGKAPRGWQRVLWSELADEFGLFFGPELSAEDFDSGWPGRSWPARLLGPDEGNLILESLRAVVQAIQEGGDPGPCYFWWWMVACMGFFKPERDYLFRGQLRDLSRFVSRKEASSPTYWWPENRSWCVATDWDFCFTVIGGSERLVARILDSPEVEGLPVSAEDALFRFREKRE